mmetsp:Transcript_36356/g.121725  ORF Transcript_36356/g.121725 Transcript_36356/m.121725 type:complete len:213 (-) Transcript_36356:58-696(-)
MHISEMSHLDTKAGRRLAKHLAESGGGAGVYDRLCALRSGGQQHRHNRQRVDEELARVSQRHRAGQADEPPSAAGNVVGVGAAAGEGGDASAQQPERRDAASGCDHHAAALLPGRQRVLTLGAPCAPGAVVGRVDRGSAHLDENLPTLKHRKRRLLLDHHSGESEVRVGLHDHQPAHRLWKILAATTAASEQQEAAEGAKCEGSPEGVELHC